MRVISFFPWFFYLGDIIEHVEDLLIILLIKSSVDAG